MKLLRFDSRRLAGCSGLVGVDEAGRGALAGPVVAAAVWFEADFYNEKRRRRAGRRINDSKQLSAVQRAECFAVIEEWRVAGLARVAVASASVEEIAVHNILGATRLAMDRCLCELHARSSGLPSAGDDTPLFAVAEPPPRPRILVDGRPLRPFSWPHEGVIDGDAKSFAVAAASIIAKVTRDHAMVALDGQFPDYGLARHKGYGTPEHWEALRRKGPCREHRHLFLRKLQQASVPVQQTEIGW